MELEIDEVEIDNVDEGKYYDYGNRVVKYTYVPIPKEQQKKRGPKPGSRHKKKIRPPTTSDAVNKFNELVDELLSLNPKLSIKKITLDEVLQF